LITIKITFLSISKQNINDCRMYCVCWQTTMSIKLDSRKAPVKSIQIDLSDQLLDQMSVLTQ